MSDVTARYAHRLSPYLRELLDGKPASHPLSRQFLPDARELHSLPQESADPIGDDAHSPVKGIVHRYADRVLLKIHHACPVYCRFCFRREMVGPGGNALSEEELAAALDYIRQRPRIWEVILTGGDPLALSARRLKGVLEQLSGIGHVAVIRIHTRAPIVDPHSLSAARLEAMAELCRRPAAPALYVAVHVNHVEELTSPVCAALETLREKGATLLSQTVLLKGINDRAETLEALFRKLVRHRVKPYYLHHPDLAPGTSHFRVSIDEGRHIVRELRGRVSGLCMPTYVLDIPGGHGKVPIGPGYLLEHDDGCSRVVLDGKGRRHSYPE